MTRKRILLGETSLLRPWPEGPRMAVPETLSAVLRRERFALPRDAGDVAALTRDGTILVTEAGTWGLAEGWTGASYRRMGQPLTPILTGARWLVGLEGAVAGGGFRPPAPPRQPDVAGLLPPMPHARFVGGNARNDAEGAPAWVKALRGGDTLFWGRWGCHAGAILFDPSSWRRFELDVLLARWRHVPAVARNIQQERDALPAPENVTGSGQYALVAYDHDGTGLSPTATGGYWVDGGQVRAAGERSAGTGYVVAAMFDAAGRCVGLAAVHDGMVRASTPLAICPVHGGVVTAKRRPGNAMGGMVPVAGDAAMHRWDDRSSRRVFLDGDAWLAPGGGYAGAPLLVRWNAAAGELVAIPVEEDSIPWGGAGPSLARWVSPAGNGLSDALGPLVLAGDGEHAVATEMPGLRRYVTPSGLVPEAVAANEHMALRGCAVRGGAVERVTAQTAAPPPGGLFGQELLPGMLLAPMRVTVGAPLEIGWWHWPERGLCGGRPRPEGLGDDSDGNDYEGGANLAQPRRSLTATSDGYLYAAYELWGPDRFGVSSHRWNGERWEIHDAEFPSLGDTRVYSGGRGSYAVFHYPGQDWSIFHAPAAYIEVFSPFFSIDWSWLSGLSPFLGGIASAMQQMEQMMQETMGQAQWITHRPLNRIITGDAMFRSWRAWDDRTSGAHWRFVDWSLWSGEVRAVFASYSGAGQPPVLWEVGCDVFRRLAEGRYDTALYEKAVRQTPVAVFPRLGLKVDLSSPEALERAEILNGLGVIDAHHVPLLPGQTAMQGVVDALAEFLARAGVSSPVWGSVTNHGLLSSMALDTAIPVRDIRLEQDGDRTWVLLRDASGVWFGAEAAIPPPREPAVLSRETPWHPIAAGWRDGRLALLFAAGVCSFDVGDVDRRMVAVTGEAFPWQRYDLWTWPERVLPVTAEVDPEQLARLRKLTKRE